MKIIYVIAAIILVSFALSDKGKVPASSSQNDALKRYDRSDPKHPMHGIYSDDNCSVEMQMKGIYNCPTKERDE